MFMSKNNTINNETIFFTEDEQKIIQEEINDIMSEDYQNVLFEDVLYEYELGLHKYYPSHEAKLAELSLRIQEYQENDNISGLGKIYSYVTSLLCREKDVKKINNIFKLLEAMSVSGKLCVEYVRIGTTAYEDENYRVAELAFAKGSVELGNLEARNSYAYMILMGEVEDSTKYSYKDIVELLRRGMEQNTLFSMINMALLCALHIGGDEGWRIADITVSMISNDVMEWWIDDMWWWKGMMNRLEGKVIHLLMLRNHVLNKSPLGEYTTLKEEIRQQVKDFPKFLLEEAV